jgi:hypothetical protein
MAGSTGLLMASRPFRRVKCRTQRLSKECCDVDARKRTPLDNDCPYCLLRRAIIAVRFSLFKPCTALFGCPSCGSIFADVDGPSNKGGRSWHKAYLRLRWKRFPPSV